MYKYDYLIVGSELFGSIFAYEANKLEKNVIFGGRLGQYKYYDMHKVIEETLKCVKEELKIRKEK